MKKPRILVADDHPIVLAGVRMLVESDRDLELAAEAKSGAEALDLIIALKPDVAILDIFMPQMNGFALARQLAKDCPSVKLIALTAHADRSYLDQALEAGMRGYVLKQSATSCLLDAIRGVLVGGLYVDPTVVGDLFSTSRRRAAASGANALTQRETEVLKLVARGLTNKEIALRLDVSIKSVDTYRARGAAKIDAKGRADIVRYASLRGWLSEG